MFAGTSALGFLGTAVSLPRPIRPYRRRVTLWGISPRLSQQQEKAGRLRGGVAARWLYSCVPSRAARGYQRVHTQGKHFGSGLAGSCQHCIFHHVPWVIPVLAPRAGRSPSVAQTFPYTLGTSRAAAGLSGKHACARPSCCWLQPLQRAPQARICSKQQQGKAKHLGVCFGGAYALQRALGMLQYLPNAPCRGLLPLHGLNAFQALLHDNEPLC